MAAPVVGERRVDDTDQPGGRGGCEENDFEEVSTIHRRGQRDRDRHQPSCSTVPPSIPTACQKYMTESEMTLRAMKLAQEMLNVTSTFLYSQGQEHILQQAMEDGSNGSSMLSIGVVN